MKFTLTDKNGNQVLSIDFYNTDPNKSEESILIAPTAQCDRSSESVGEVAKIIASDPSRLSLTIMGTTIISSAILGGIACAKNAIANIVVAENKFGDVTVGDKLADTKDWLLMRFSFSKSDIVIKHINFNKMLKHIEDLYGEKRLTGLFDPKYKMFDEWLYKRKVISRKKDIGIKNLRFKKFFALEVYNLFVQLYDATGYKTYRRAAKIIKKHTFLKNIETLEPKMEPLDANLKKELVDNPLKPHQEEFVRLYRYFTDILGLRGLILSFDQGLGKTLTSLALAEELHKKQVVIFCLKTMTTIWGDEICDKFAHIKNNPENKNEVFVFEDKVERYGTYDKAHNKYVIANFESINKISQYIDFGKETMVIVDECQNFRNTNGIRWAALWDIINKFKEGARLDILPMSGTPIKAKPSEIVPALMCIDPTFDEEAAAIYTRCFNIDATTIGEIVNQRFGLVIYRKLKSETLDLPPKTTIYSEYKLSDPTPYLLENVQLAVQEAFERHYAELYDDILPFKEQYERYVRKYTSKSVDPVKKQKYLNYLSNTLVKGERVFLHELTAQEFETFGQKYIIPNITDKKELEEFKMCQTRYVRIHNSAMGKAVGEVYPPRIAQMFCQIIDEHENEIVQKIEADKYKVCLFASRLEVVDRLKKMCDDNGLNCVVITGSNARQRKDLIDKFREDDTVDVLVAMNTTMGTGVTLVEADHEMIFGTPWRQADLDQLSDRIHRIGQIHDVTIEIFGLNSPGHKNLYDRMIEILTWSGEMTDTYIDGINGLANKVGAPELRED